MLKDQRAIIHEGILSEYDQSQVVVFGLPFDGTVSYRPGTRFGPQMIRNELDGLETYSPYLDKDMVDYSLCDLGDLPLPFGNTEKVMTLIEEEVGTLLEDGKKLLAIGGEHLVSYPVIKAHLKKYKDLHIIHLDAHADLREDYLGESLSHATVMRRVYEQLNTGKIWQFGIRSGTKEEFQFAKTHTKMHPFDLKGLDKAVHEIGQDPVYVTIDLDVLDPSIFSGTGTPEPGGATFKELMEAMGQLTRLNIVGGDLVELSPNYDQSGVSTLVACKVLRELSLVLANHTT
ncbi:agmatinase [Vallitalea pronyensis]|uniref:Agmatinase n=1 Tax=Vallitalea pronyensis TaxID=1348613 RepID=A0A8J8SFI4_9FIRM|nr:agmatinase [Vallitalea pronyensis]QUI21700.1 agmatinase [Vallitalea pronyensis]